MGLGLEFKVVTAYRVSVMLMHSYHMEACPRVSTKAEGRKQETLVLGPAESERVSFPLLLSPDTNPAVLVLAGIK